MADDEAQSTAVVVRERPQRIVVESAASIMDTARFEHLGRVARIMADAGLMPESLTHIGPKDRREPLQDHIVTARAFLIAAQADRWNMDPMAVMNCCSLVHNKLMYEGKLVSAVLEGRLGVRLSYEFGAWDPAIKRVVLNVTTPEKLLGVVVSGTLPGETVPRTVEGYVGAWETPGSNSPWSNPANWRRQLRYRGSREWANAYSAGVILGVLTDDDIDDAIARSIEVRQEAPTLDAAFGKAGKAPSRKKLAAEPTKDAGDNSADRGQTEVVDPQTGEVTETKGEPSSKDIPADGKDAQREPAEPATPASSAGTEAGTSSGGESIVSDDDFPGDRPAPGDATKASQVATTVANPETKATPTLDIEAFNAYGQKIAACDSWLTIRPAINAFRRSDAFTTATQDDQIRTLLLAFNRTAEIKDPVLPQSDPAFYELWLYQAPSHEIDSVWPALTRSVAYQKISDAERERLADLTEAQKS